MINLNTNLSSLITQRSLVTSTQRLNQAIEQMTTGFKINHAKDNAANYNITTNMTTKIGAYMVAEDNCAMGLDMITTASDSVALMHDKAERLRALCIQTQNGTYGAQSLLAVNSEAEAIVSEINRIYSTAKYNGVSLFSNSTNSEVQFIADPMTYTDEEIEAMLANGDIVALDDNITSFISGMKYLISDKTELVRLATLVNGGQNGDGATFILGIDIDLGAYCNQEITNGNGGWTPIGNDTNKFKGTFDGNGHVIKNLKIERSADYQGLFGYTDSGSKIINIGIEGGYVKGNNDTGCLVGSAKSLIENCYATGEVIGTKGVGGLVGETASSFDSCYATVVVTGSDNYVGGLVGKVNYPAAYIKNSYATGGVSGASYVGGLVGDAYVSISNSYAMGNVSGIDHVGGIAGYAYKYEIKNSYATGNVSGTGDYVAGLVAYAHMYKISNCCATGDVSGANYVGGLVSNNKDDPVSNSYATGNVTGDSYVGGLVGYAGWSINNCYATGEVTASGSNVGGFAGVDYTSVNCYATGDVSATGSYVGGFSGKGSKQTNCYATGNVSGTNYVGGLIGYGDAYNANISNSFATGDVTGTGYVGGFVGYLYNASISNCYATGDVTATGSNVGGFAGLSGGSFTNIVSVQTDSYATQMTIEEINTTYTPEFLGFTEAKGWTIENGIPIFTLNFIPQVPENNNASATGAGYFSMRIGIYSNDSSQIGFEIDFTYDLSSLIADISSDEALNSVDNFLAQLNRQSTKLGAAQNRLESALDEISVQYENLVSSRSTLRDADIAEVSSEYIRQQILQQASATLMATANQSPSIALQLI